MVSPSPLCETCVLREIGFNPGGHVGEFLVNSGTLTDARPVWFRLDGTNSWPS